MTNAVALLSLLLQYTDKLSAMAQLLSKASSEGRDITNVELDDLFGDDDEARARLIALIDAAQSAK
jgi:hypothetical protein